MDRVIIIRSICPGTNEIPDSGRIFPHAVGTLRKLTVLIANDARGIINDAQERTGRLCSSAKHGFWSMASTVGLLGAIAACCKPGDSLLMGRNCHKAVYNGVYLNGLNPVYIYPEVHGRFGFTRRLTQKMWRLPWMGIQISGGGYHIANI